MKPPSSPGRRAAVAAAAADATGADRGDPRPARAAGTRPGRRKRRRRRPDARPRRRGRCRRPGGRSRSSRPRRWCGRRARRGLELARFDQASRSSADASSPKMRGHLTRGRLGPVRQRPGVVGAEAQRRLVVRADDVDRLRGVVVLHRRHRCLGLLGALGTLVFPGGPAPCSSSLIGDPLRPAPARPAHLRCPAVRPDPAGRRSTTPRAARALCGRTPCRSPRRARG